MRFTKPFAVYRQEEDETNLSFADTGLVSSFAENDSCDLPSSLIISASHAGVFQLFLTGRCCYAGPDGDSTMAQTLGDGDGRPLRLLSVTRQVAAALLLI